jgi:hypothetical protein
MAGIRNEMQVAGLPCAFPAVLFPGWKVSDMDRKKGVLEYTLKLAGLELNL